LDANVVAEDKLRKTALAITSLEAGESGKEKRIHVS
jgi:hypothetical protein